MAVRQPLAFTKVSLFVVQKVGSQLVFLMFMVLLGVSGLQLWVLGLCTVYGLACFGFLSGCLVRVFRDRISEEGDVGSLRFVSTPSLLNRV